MCWRELFHTYPAPNYRFRLGRNSGSRFKVPVAKQNSHVLAGSNEVVLNLVPPKPAPARSLEAMAIGGIGETSFHEVLPAPAIFFGRWTVSSGAHEIQYLLAFETVNAPPGFAGGALLAQGALGADRSRCLILPGWLVSTLLIAAQALPGGAPVSVAGRIIAKSIFLKNRLARTPRLVFKSAIWALSPRSAQARKFSAVPY